MLICKIVAGNDAGLAATVLFENDPVSHRHEHAQNPSGFTVPTPFAMAPDEPTADGSVAKVRISALSP